MTDSDSPRPDDDPAAPQARPADGTVSGPDATPNSKSRAYGGVEHPLYAASLLSLSMASSAPVQAEVDDGTRSVPVTTYIVDHSDVTDISLSDFYEHQIEGDFPYKLAQSGDCSSCSTYPSRPSYPSKPSYPSPPRKQYPSAPARPTPRMCAIATLSVGILTGADLEVLRTVRDRLAHSGTVGQAIVTQYYRLSPAAIAFVSSHPNVAIITRAGMRVLSRVARALA